MMNVIDANTTGILNFGYQGEKDRTIVRFDIADIVNAFPGGTPTLAYKAPGSNAYSPIHIEFDGTVATWVLDRTDTNKSGIGMCQLIYTNGAIVKTRKWKTYVEESVDGEDDLLPPPDWEDWKNELLQLGNTIVQAVSAYNDMDAEATALPAGSDPTARIDHTGEIPILQLGLPEPPSGGAVQSVNGKTGAVELNAEDVNALPKTDPNVENSLSMGRVPNSVIGQSSVALGDAVVASGRGSSAIGGACSATGVASHAEGANTTASGLYSHAEGGLSTASGRSSHTEGERSNAYGDVSHAEGYMCETHGSVTHAEGSGNIANGICCHVEGYKNTANGNNQHVQGMWSIADNNSAFCHIVGNGTDNDHRSNAHTIDWSGNAEFAGDVKANACGGQNPVSLVAVANELVNKTNKIDLQLIENYSYNFETETSFERRMTPSGDPYNFEFIDIEVVVNPGGTVGNYGVITYFDETSDPQSMFECSRVNASEYKSHFGGFMLPVGGNLFLPIHFVTTNTGNPNTLAAKSHWTANNTITHFREIKKWKGLRIDAITGSGEIRIWAGNRR